MCSPLYACLYTDTSILTTVTTFIFVESMLDIVRIKIDHATIFPKINGPFSHCRPHIMVVTMGTHVNITIYKYTVHVLQNNMVSLKIITAHQFSSNVQALIVTLYQLRFDTHCHAITCCICTNSCVCTLYLLRCGNVVIHKWSAFKRTLPGVRKKQNNTHKK